MYEFGAEEGFGVVGLDDEGRAVDGEDLLQGLGNVDGVLRTSLVEEGEAGEVVNEYQDVGVALDPWHIHKIDG